MMDRFERPTNKLEVYYSVQLSYIIAKFCKMKNFFMLNVAYGRPLRSPRLPLPCHALWQARQGCVRVVRLRLSVVSKM